MRYDAQLPRRSFLRTSALAAAAILAGRRPPGAAAEPPLTADQALQKLVDGNKRFVAGKDTAAEQQRSPQRRIDLTRGQNPFAVIVTCSDSRVAPELLFDQGLGDLFVIRVAGNIVTGAGPAVKGSIEYGVAELGSPLVLVLGHSKCGAIQAALKHIENKDSPPGSIGELVQLLQPTAAKIKGQPGDPVENAIRANVEAGVERLKALEPILAPAVQKQTVKVIGATYDLRSGVVSLVPGRK